MNAPREPRLAVGHGTFDPLSGVLCLDGRCVKLRPRTATLLSYLVQHPDRALAKDELMRAVWPDAVVTDDSLVQCVKEIRHALGDAGREWIRTLPRQGYAFVARVADSPDSAAAAEALPAPPSRSYLQRASALVSRWRGVAVVMAALLVAAGALALRQWGGPGPRAGGAPALSIVVMPVANFTSDPAHDNVVDDLTESLADALARASGVAVIAPRTAFTFKGSTVDVRQIGKLLNVRYVLEGSLRLEASQPVLTMRLADASSAVQLWSQEFSSAAVPDLRGLVAGQVAGTLGLQLIRADTGANGHGATAPKALEALSRARAVLRWAVRGPVGMAQARGLLQEALRHDAALTEAWALLASTYLYDVRFSPTRDQDLASADAAVQRALGLAPDHDGVRVVEGRVLYERGRMADALAAFDRAALINPNNVAALGFRGATLVMLGRPEEALLQIEQAIRLSPRDPQLAVWQMFGGVAHLHQGHHAAAIEWLAQAVEGHPASPFGRLFLASALGASGRIAEAKVQMAQLQQMRPGLTLGRFRAVEPSDAPAFLSQRERVYEGLRRAGMPE